MFLTYLFKITLYLVFIYYSIFYFVLSLLVYLFILFI